MEADRAPTPTSHWGLALWRRGVAERTYGGLAPPPKDQSWGPDSIVLRLGPGVSLPARTGRTDDMRAWSHRPRLLPTRNSTRGTDGSRPPTSAIIGGRDPRPRAATAGGEFPRTGSRVSANGLDPRDSRTAERPALTIRPSVTDGPPAVVPPKRARLGRARPGALAPYR